MPFLRGICLLLHHSRFNLMCAEHLHILFMHENSKSLKKSSPSLTTMFVGWRRSEGKKWKLTQFSLIHQSLMCHRQTSTIDRFHCWWFVIHPNKRQQTRESRFHFNVFFSASSRCLPHSFTLIKFFRMIRTILFLSAGAGINIHYSNRDAATVRPL